MTSEDEEDGASLETPLSPRSTKNAKHNAAKRKRQAAWPEDRKEHEKQRLAFYQWQGRQLKELYASPEYQSASEAEKPVLVDKFKDNCRLKRIAEGKHHSLTSYGLSQAEKLQAQPRSIVPAPKVTPPIPLINVSTSTMAAAQHSYLSTLPEAQRLYLIQPDDSFHRVSEESASGLTTSDVEDSSLNEELDSGPESRGTTQRERMILNAKIEVTSEELQRLMAERERLQRK